MLGKLSAVIDYLSEFLVLKGVVIALTVPVMPLLTLFFILRVSNAEFYERMTLDEPDFSSSLLGLSAETDESTLVP